MIVVSMMVRNEADRYLRQALDCVRQIPNSLIMVTDDASDDDTAQICRDYGAIVQVNERPEFWANEGRARQKHYEWTSSRCQTGDWVLSLDADETISHPEKLADVVKVAHHGGYAALGMPLYEFWTPTQYRTDGFWFGTLASRCYRWKQHGEIADREMGCGSEPTYVQAALKLGGSLYRQQDIRLLHWGYLNPEDRVRKHAAYTERLGGHGHNNAHVASIVGEPTLAEYSYDEEALCREWVGYVKGIARKYGSDPEIESDALLGLVQATRAWDPQKSGFKTYLSYRIPGAILDGMRARDYASRSARKNLSEDDVRLKAPTSLDALREEFGYDAADDVEDVFEELRREAEMRARCEALFTYAAMALTPREYEVLYLYYREGLTLWKIGEGLGVTESRCSQVLKSAEYKLRQSLCTGNQAA